MTQPPKAVPAASRSTPGAEPISIARVFERLASHLELVERTMLDQLEGESGLMVLIGDHVVSSGGKRLRPALVLLTAELCGYTGPRRVQIAAAIELLHTATLLHADVVDFSDLRRGRPSANAIWGNRRAVLAGDFLYARSSTIVIDDGSMEIMESFADTIRLMAEGELLQLEFSFDTVATEAQYYKVIDRKSAQLLRSACEAGAILGGATKGERRKIGEFGRELGLAFQLRDDALDYQAPSQETGKPAYTDLREGKVTLPLLLTLKRCTGNERELISRAVKRSSQVDAEVRLATDASNTDPALEADFESIIQLVERYHGVADTIRRAEERVAKARASLAMFPDIPAKHSLLTAAEYVVGRDH
ncbi:MAG: polyprenyl synthetase family protein [Myxococcota bacterium]|nr:polyprenyl synthetase family protein [Myxococcota bacterium]